MIMNTAEAINANAKIKWNKEKTRGKETKRRKEKEGEEKEGEKNMARETLRCFVLIFIGAAHQA
jgi:hypothetical protein